MKTDNKTNQTSAPPTQTTVAATPSTKTGRRNKTRLELKLPESGTYTIEELCSSNPEFVEITLRVRLKKLVSDGKVVELGTLHMAKGRPKMVCATSPVSESTLTAARDAGVSFNEKFNMPILSIKDGDKTTSVAIADAVVTA